MTYITGVKNTITFFNNDSIIMNNQ